MVVAAAVATGLFVTGAAPAADKSDTGKMGGMMSGNMMIQMPKMMMSQTETGKLVDQLVKNFAAIEAEKDPAALRAKLAKHDALLKELQTKVQAQSHMMEMMQHMMMGGAMMGGSQTCCEGKK
jgi:hypothetical protein